MLILLITLAAPSLTVVTEDDRATAQLVMAGHADSRERLRAGVFRGTGSRDFKSERTGLDTSEDVKIFCAFDYDKGLLRFERIEPPVNPQSKSAWGGRFLRTRTGISQCNAGPNTVSISPPGTKPLGHIMPFDVRAIGSLNLTELEDGSTFEDAFAVDRGFTSQAPLVEVTQESDTIYRLGWDLADGKARRTIWFDSHFGYSPIRLEDSEFGDAKRRRAPANIVEVSWRSEQGAFVPETLRLERYVGAAKRGGRAATSTVYSFQLVWEAINREIPGDVFNVEKLGDDLPRTMFVVDDRLGGKPILVKRTDRDGAIPTSASGGQSSLLIIALVANVAILAFVMIALIVRARRRTA